MSPPVRVLRVITRLNVGGPSRHVFVLAKGLRPEYETLLAAGTPAALEGDMEDASVAVRRVPGLVRQPRPLDDLRAQRELRKLVRDFAPDIVHTHMAKAGALGRMAARSASGVRTVHTFHGHVLEGYFRPSVQRAFIEVERRLARRTDILVAVSEHVRDSLLDLGIGTPGQYRVIRLGLELDEHLAAGAGRGTLRRSLALPPEVPLVGIVGRLAPIKDHATALEAVASLDGVHLAVLGDGELRTALQRRAAELGIAGRTHFTGWWADMPGAMADLDVVLLTSRNEGTPVSLIEAHASGRPAVATRVGGVESVVRHQETGLLAPAADPAAIADAIRQLLSDRELREGMGVRGREWVRERFSSTRLVHDIRVLYEELLA